MFFTIIGPITNPLRQQRYTYKVLQTTQIKLILLCDWAMLPFWVALKLLENSNTKCEYAITHGIQCMGQGTIEWPMLWRITKNSLHSEGIYK